MRFIAGIIERFIFVMAFIYAMQLPGYFEHYQNELTTYQQSSQQQLKKFANLKQQRQAKSFDALLYQLKNSEQTADHKKAAELEKALQEKQLLHKLRPEFEHASWYIQVWNIARHPQNPILQETWEHYQPTLDFSIAGLGCGLFAMIILWWIKSLFGLLFRPRRRLFNPEDNPLR